MNKKIIGIVGFIGSGKGTISDHLVGKYGYRTESFAKPVKDAVSDIFGWDRHLLEGDTIESREFRETVDEWWAEQLGIKNFTPRWMLQQFGTDIMRENFSQDIWIKSMKKRLINNESDIVITDCRFQNEISTIKSLGGIIVRTKRGNDPVWFNDAIATNNGSSNAMYLRSEIHPSEWGWIGSEIDYLLENDGSKEEFHQKIDEMIKSI